MAAGVFNGDWLYIQDVRTTGGATFNATNSIGIGDVTGWNITPIAGQDLYWIGGSGNWTDTLHWSTVSGGTPYGCLPTVNDNIFFDASSFSDLDTVNVDDWAYCKSMDWTGAGFNPEFTGWATIYINGSLTLIPAMTYTHSGPFKFLSDTCYTITTAGFTISNIYFDG